MSNRADLSICASTTVSHIFLGLPSASTLEQRDHTARLLPDGFIFVSVQMQRPVGYRNTDHAFGAESNSAY